MQPCKQIICLVSLFKIFLKINFLYIASFSCRERQAFLPDIQINIQLNNEGVRIFSSVKPERTDTLFCNLVVILIPMVYNTPWLIEEIQTVSKITYLHSKL